MGLRYLAVTASTAALLALVGLVFWREDLRYRLPTPRPASLRQPALGAVVPVRALLAEAGLVLPSDGPTGRPVHLHFFNPECPCSRFNLDHVRSLVARFSDRVQFVAVVQSARGDDAALAARVASLELRMPWVRDDGGRIAARLGVYSTPQAALVDAGGALRYRGNYNLSRFCADRETEYARLALESLLGERPGPAPSAQPAYGCGLPSNESAALAPRAPSPARPLVAVAR